MPPSSLPALDLGAPVLLSALHLWDEACQDHGLYLITGNPESVGEQPRPWGCCVCRANPAKTLEPLSLLPSLVVGGAATQDPGAPLITAYLLVLYVTIDLVAVTISR
jgi:hypothetical protein